MTSVQTAEQAGHERSEDVVRVLPNAVALLDGATALRPTERTGGWYAELLADALAARLTRDGDLADLLADAIAEVSRSHDLRPGQAPSSTVALLRWDAQVVEALVLADSPVILFTATGPEVVTDDRLAKLRTPGRGGYRERLRQGLGFGAEHWTALTSSMDRTASWRNVEGGFWVAEAVPEAAYQAVRTRRDRSEVDCALLASDGVSCGVDDYGTYRDWAEVLTEINASGPHAVLDRIRAAENSDPDGARWPRPKRHDDQALAVVRLTTESGEAIHENSPDKSLRG